MHLFECYRLAIDKVDLQGRFIRVDGSKGHRGVIKPRVVPISTVLADTIRPFCIDRVGLLFPYWNGAKEDRAKCVVSCGSGSGAIQIQGRTQRSTDKVKLSRLADDAGVQHQRDAHPLRPRSARPLALTVRSKPNQPEDHSTEDVRRTGKGQPQRLQALQVFHAALGA